MFVREIACPRCARSFPSQAILNLCGCGSPLFVGYDFGKIKARVKRSELEGRPPTLWRYREFLPLRSDRNRVSLGEGFTPLIEARRLASELGLRRVLIKDEGRNPTGSFKDRGLSLAISMARQLGIQRVAIPSAGNAGASLAAYASRAGMEAYVFMPRDTPKTNILEVEKYGARLELVDGLISDCGRLVARGRDQGRWFDVSTLKEPYRVEGKKTLAFEIAEQLDWKLPDVIVYPTGGGTGLIGMWKGFMELERVGWIGRKRPRMVAVQAEGCAPIVRAFVEGKDKAEPWLDARTIASGLRVPEAVADFLMLKVIRESRGKALSVGDAEMVQEIDAVARLEGLFISPEAGASFAGLRRLVREGWVRNRETVLLLNTASGLKYVDVLATRRNAAR